MTAAQLYQAYGIQPAEYSAHDKPEDLARKLMDGYQFIGEQKTVVYSTGTSSVGTGQSLQNNGQVLYSY